MKVIPPFPIMENSGYWTCNIPENVPGTWDSGATYGVGNFTKMDLGEPNIRSQYISLQSGNLNHNPSTSPSWWKFAAYQYQIYSAAISYSIGAIVLDTTTHSNYRSLVNSNLANPVTDTTKWFKHSPSNPTAALTLGQSIKTKANISLVFTIRVSLYNNLNLNSLALFGLWATAVNIKIEDFGVAGYYYNQTFTLTPSNKPWLTYGSWRTGPNGPLYQNTLVVFNLPDGADPVITITIDNTDGDPGQTHTKVGAIILGHAVDIGGVEYGALNDAMNFSTVSRSFDGKVDSVVKRRSIPRNNYSTYAPSTSIDELYKLRDVLNAEIAAWFGVEDYTATQFDSLAILGFYKRFSINIDQQDRVRVDLEIEEA